MQHVSFKNVPQASKFQIVARKKSVFRQKSARQLFEYDLQTFLSAMRLNFLSMHLELPLSGIKRMMSVPHAVMPHVNRVNNYIRHSIFVSGEICAMNFYARNCRSRKG